MSAKPVPGTTQKIAECECGEQIVKVGSAPWYHAYSGSHAC